ncbi:MAG TPA: hypothetical protein VGE45_17105 [Chloroflexia bacterium]|jgi:hypothetical protein
MADHELRQEIRRLCADLDNVQGQAEVMRRVLELNRAFFTAALGGSSYDASRKTVGTFVGGDVLYDSLERVNEALSYLERHQTEVRSSPTERELFQRNNHQILDATLKKGDGTEPGKYEIDWGDTP